MIPVTQLAQWLNERRLEKRWDFDPVDLAIYVQRAHYYSLEKDNIERPIAALRILEPWLHKGFALRLFSEQERMQIVGGLTNIGTKETPIVVAATLPVDQLIEVVTSIAENLQR